MVLVSFFPEAVDRTRIRLATLVPDTGEPYGDKEREYWTKNHDLTSRTLGEDFIIGENIQSGFSSNVNDALTFGRFEGALDCFNRAVEDACGMA